MRPCLKVSTIKCHFSIQARKVSVCVIDYQDSIFFDGASKANINYDSLSMPNKLHDLIFIN